MCLKKTKSKIAKFTKQVLYASHVKLDTFYKTIPALKVNCKIVLNLNLQLFVKSVKTNINLLKMRLKLFAKKSKNKDVCWSI